MKTNNLFTKTHKFIFCVCFLGALLSCSKEEFNTNNIDSGTTSQNFTENNEFENSIYGITQERSYDSLYNDIVKIEKTRNQIVVASALSPEEKLGLWYAKLDNFINNNSLTTEQTNLINQLKNEITIESLIKGSEEREYFINNRVPYYLSTAQDLFGVNEGRYLLTKVENINHRIDRLNGDFEGSREYYGDPISACDCSKDGECWRITGIGIDGISWENGRCSENDCYVKTYFFGWFESGNNGICKY